MKIAIAGPGRSGTSLLVRVLAAWGFSTPSAEGNWHVAAQAGLESRIGADSPFEVDKDPWAYEYLDRISPAVLAHYDALLVPLRDRQDVALSRSVQERLHRLKHSESDRWQWDSWGSVPGGAVSQTHADAISETLANGLWDLLEQATRNGLSPYVINFPRFAHDFDYLWSIMEPLVEGRQTRESARTGWEQVVDLSKVRIGRSARDTSPSLSLREMQELIEAMRLENREALENARDAIAQRDAALEQRDDVLAQRDVALRQLHDAESQRDAALHQGHEAAAQRDAAVAQMNALLNSRLWRSTEWYRRLKSDMGSTPSRQAG